MTLTSKTRPVVRRRAPHFKSKFITTELARLFSQSDSEEEEFQGFSDEEEQRSSRGLKDEEEEEQRSRGVSKRLKNMKVESEEEEDSDVDIGFYSDGEDASPPRRSLCVAMRFPTKRLSTPTTQEVPQKRAKRAAAARAPPPPPSRRSSRTTPSPPSRRSSRTTPSPPSRRSSRTTPSPSSRSSRTTPSPPCRRSTRRLPKQEEEEQETTTEEVLEKEHRPQRVLLSQILKKEQRPPQRELLLSQILKKEQRPPQRELLLSQILKKQEKKPHRELLLSQSLKKQQERPEQVDLLPQSLKKRNENILENKAMLAKLFSELSTMAELTPLNSPQKKKQTTDKSTARKRRFEAEAGSERRNPSRKARPPENFGVEERSESPSRGGGGRGGPRTVDIRRLLEVDEEGVDASGRKKRRSCVRSGHARSSRYVVRSVDDITRDDLNNIAHRAKDKIWDKENGSSCHQCRQKTLDTKTVCRSGFCSGGKGQFCGPCLKNRYGEDVGTVLLDPEWSCPICRNVCNCSLCRKKEGRCATGILVGLARYNGHDNVHEYLERIQKELS